MVLALALLAAACTNGDESSSSTTDQAPDSSAPTTATTAPSTTVSSTETTDTSEPVATGLEWTDCEPLECATLTVPLDHSDPDGNQIEIAVARLAAPSQADRIGSLVLNPGGPGGSGIEFLESAAFTIPQEVQNRFDLVGFDPRGVGSSTAVDCDADYDNSINLLTEGDDAAWENLQAQEQELLASCPVDAIELARFVGTNNAARDLDLLREALGDQKLTYVGYSYGTRLGATYAELFPNNVRALVLDGGVLPSDDFAAVDLEQAGGFDVAFNNFAAACDADSDCVLQELGPTIEVFRAVGAEIQEFGEFETDDPDRVLTAGEFYLGVLAALYSKDAWPFLADGLFAAETLQDGTLLQVLGDNLVGRQTDGSYNNSNEANSAINCADNPNRPTPTEARAEAEAAAARTVYFDQLFRGISGCLLFPEALDPLIIGPASGAPPILVIGNTGDPATPFAWSVALADSLDSGVLYEVEAEGHTAYGSIECVTPTVNAYLIDLEAPADGSTCSDNASADFFPPAGESEIDLVVAFFACLREQGLEMDEVTAADILADPTGEELFAGIDLEDPVTVSAFLACQSFLPGG